MNIKLLLSILITSLFLFSCNKDNKSDLDISINKKLILSENEYIIEEDGDTIKVELEDNIEYFLKMPDVNWISENPILAPNIKQFIIKPNDTYDNRKASICFSTKDSTESINIFQVQKDAIVISKDSFIIENTGGDLEITVASNIDFSINISDSDNWITRIETRSLTNHKLNFKIRENPDIQKRIGKITFKSTKGIEQTVIVIQDAISLERAALIAIYNATNGKNWKKKDNWCTDKPIEEWYGVQVHDGKVTYLGLDRNNLCGVIPSQISMLKHLKFLSFYSNNITGKIPNEICKLSQLETLFLGANRLEGEIPAEIGKLSKLQFVELGSNNLIGNLPISLIDLSNLTGFYVDRNRLSGSIPYAITKSRIWEICAPARDIFEQQEGYILYLEHYISTDYSQDGEVVLLQKASKGNGVNIVFLGDGFVDRDMTDGNYDKVMKQAMGYFFSQEPTHTFQDYFNVYYVKAVSKNNTIGNENSTVFNTSFQGGGSTLITGDNTKCIEYASKALSMHSRPTVIIVILNDTRYAGTCYWEWDTSIAYCPIVYNNVLDKFEETIQHEALWHGLGLLGDEYVEKFSEEHIPLDLVKYYRDQQKLGRCLNLDFTDNENEVLWNKFIFDDRYKNEQIGIYEGGLNYGYGVYRATKYSTVGNREFNAPNRNIIYKRIIELAGEKYSWEKFIEYDIINYSKVRTKSIEHENFKPLHSPIIIR